MRFVFILCLLIMPTAVQASEIVVIDDNTCRAWVRHVPDAGVAYQPGVDVHGKPVVEADVNAAPITVPETIAFDITVDVARYAGIPVPQGTEMQATMGRVEVARDGSMTFNGQPMGGNAAVALRDLCADKPLENSHKRPLSKARKNNYNR